VEKMELLTKCKVCKGKDFFADDKEGIICTNCGAPAMSIAEIRKFNKLYKQIVEKKERTYPPNQAEGKKEGE
jgi:Zn finger protein HypA/HybF involved in hydrogenase expression